MAPWSTHLLLSVTLALLTTVLVVQGYKVNLNEQKDMSTGYWLTISCRYYENYTAYETGFEACPFNQTWLTEEDFENRSGLWAPCSHETCEILYYGGRNLPRPKSVQVTGVATNLATIVIEAASTQTQTNYRSVGAVAVSDPPKWDTFDFGADFTDNDVFFRFTMTTTIMTSFAMIDKIVIDLGDEVEKPPAILLDDRLDMGTQWTVNCFYAESLDDFWVYGYNQCPTVQDDSGSLASQLGFWAPCTATHCDFTLKVGKVVNKQRYPRVVTFDGQFKNGSKITVSAKSNLLGAKFKPITASEGLVNASQWQIQLANDCSYKTFNFSISGPRGSVLIDSITVVDFHENEPCHQPPITPATTTTTTTTMTTTDSNNGQEKTAILSGLFILLAAVFAHFF